MMIKKNNFRHFKQVIQVSLLIFLIGANVVVANAANKNPSTHISFGQYTTTDGDDTVTGSRLSVSYVKPITDLLSYFIKISNGSATGTHSNDDDTETNIKSSHTNLGSGLQVNFDLTDKDKYILFLGSGLLLQSYQYDFDYPNSETGETSGTGYGYNAFIGFKYRAAKNFIIIPSYNYEQVIITSEDGTSRNPTTAGTSLALAIAF
jgi:hypothetical protein